MIENRIPENLQNYRVKWGPIGEPVYKRSYSRIKENGENETYPETVIRAVDGNLSLVDSSFIEPDERGKLINLMLEFGEIPAGRHLYASGVKGRQFLFNCNAAGWDPEKPADHFTFLFDELMQGGGVGSNYSNRYLDQLPPISRRIDLHITCRKDHPNYSDFFNLTSTHDGLAKATTLVVEDSREGWSEAIDFVLKNAWDRSSNDEVTLVIDVSKIRARGLPLKTSGGISCGPGPLVLMLHDFCKQLNSRHGRRLTSLDAMTLDHILASCVIAGGKRRSSRMSVKNWKDSDIFEFINCKRTDGLHWSTNISVEVDDEFIEAYKSGDKHAKEVARAVVLGKRVNGEPGLWNRSLAMKGEREPEKMFCPNPCGEIGLQMWENCFAGDVKFITKEYGAVRFIDVVGQTVTVPTPQGWKPGVIRQFGEQIVQRVVLAPVRRNTGSEGYQKTRSNYRVDIVVTTNHRWERIDGTVTDSLHVGDVIPMSAAPFEKNEDYKKGVQHGIIFGDGSADRQYADGAWRHRIRLFGDKAEEMAKFFDHLTYPQSCDGAPEAWLKSEKNLKEFPDGSEGSDYLSGFITGWGMADATEKENGTLHLGSSHPHAETWLRENAAAAGWVLRAAKDSGTTETNYGKRKNPLMFFTLCRPDTDGLAWQVVSIEPLEEKVPVYCVTVPGVERFTLASGVLTCNCNLGHVNLQYFANRPQADAEEAFRLMTRWLIRATYGDIPQPRQREVVSRNRRIGVGFFGYHGWLALRFQEKYSTAWKNENVKQSLRRFKNAVEREAQRYSQMLGIPTPVKNTALAPTGTIALMPGVSASGQAIIYKRFKRLVRYADTDPELQVKKIEGYKTYKDEDANNTEIVEYWCEDPIMELLRVKGLDPDELIESQDEVRLEDSLRTQAMLQDCYADNAISFTINMPEDKMPSEEEMERLFIEALPFIKGTTFFPEKSRKNAPYQKLSKEEWDAYTGRKEVVQVEDECKGGCPIR
jgi:ribonucleotide reductase alpha subunit